MMRAFLAFSPLVMLAACGGEGQLGPEAMVAGEAPQSQVQTGSVELLAEPELANLLANDKVTLIDVRAPEEFAEGHIPGAINYPVDDFDPATIPAVAGKETILYCRSARRSERAAQMLAEHTGEKVRHLEGGILAWQEAGGEVVLPDQ